MLQALYELGDIATAVAMAHDSVLGQKNDGRLAVICDNIAVTDPAANGEMVYMAYEVTKDDMYRDAALKMLDYLMEKAPRTNTGLLYHIYDAGQERFLRKKLWATGNGWALLGMARVIDEALNADNEEIAEKLITMGRDLLDNVLKYQLEDGRFHDFLDEKASFADGASAMMVATFIYRGFNQGWLEEKYLSFADEVYITMDNYVDEFGLIHEVCGCPDFNEVGTSAESMAAYLMMHAWK